jgi:hypothetical protein
VASNAGMHIRFGRSISEQVAHPRAQGVMISRCTKASTKAVDAHLQIVHGYVHDCQMLYKEVEENYPPAVHTDESEECQERLGSLTRPKCSADAASWLRTPCMACSLCYSPDVELSVHLHSATEQMLAKEIAEANASCWERY